MCPYEIPKLAEDFSNRFENFGRLSWGSSTNMLNTSHQPMSEHNTTADGGTLSFFYSQNWSMHNYRDQECCTGEDVRLFFLVAVNGELCDFTFGDEASRNGILETTRQLNIEREDPVTVRDATLHKGKNSVAVYRATYYPQIADIVTDAMTRIFHSDVETVQSAPPAIYAENLGEHLPADAPSVGAPQSEIVVQALGNNGMTRFIRAGEALRYHYYKNAHERAEAEMFLAFKNGKLIPAWNGAYMAMEPLNETDAAIDFTLDASLAAGETAVYHVASFGLAKDDLDTVDTCSPGAQLYGKE